MKTLNSTKIKQTLLLFLLICTAFIFTGITAKAQETYSIKGTVSDEKGETLPGATAFLANSKKATATDASGKFILSELQPGVYELVIKMLGFDTYTQSIIIQKSSPNLAIILKDNSTLLNTVTITSDFDSLRQVYLKYFTKYFLGESANSRLCKILNPEVIKLTYDNSTFALIASADKFIIIENRALGYTVHYLLTNFQLHMTKQDADYQVVSRIYDGSSYFEELKGTEAEQAMWERNRRLTYEGSPRHFYRAAFNNTIKDEGFRIYAPKLSDSDTLFTSVDKNIKLFNLKTLKGNFTQLYVVYTQRNPPVAFTSSRRRLGLPAEINRSGQASVIHPVLDSLLIDKNGNTNPTSGAVGYSGYWTWTAVSGLLPPDYQPPVINSEATETETTTTTTKE